jgi:hypothetical protein
MDEDYGEDGDIQANDGEEDMMEVYEDVGAREDVRKTISSLLSIVSYLLSYLNITA